MNTREPERPFVPEYGHPIQTKRYIIATPQIELLSAHVIGLINNRTTGGVVHAPPRTGKTRGLEILKLELGTVFKGLPVVQLPAWGYERPKFGPFMEDLLRAANHAIIKRGSPEDKRDRLVEFWAELGTEGGYNCILLIVDEAQNLFEDHYSWLKGIYNLLLMREVSLITLLVGPQELVYQRNAFLKARKDHITGRFMIKVFEFSGIRHVRDVKEVLVAFDEEEFPVGSGWSFARYFQAEQFGRGWRLASLSKDFWECFLSARSLSEVDRRRSQDIPMEYFCRTVEFFLLNFGAVENPDFTDIKKTIDTGIAQSGYLDLLLLE